MVRRHSLGARAETAPRHTLSRGTSRTLRRLRAALLRHLAARASQPAWRRAHRGRIAVYRAVRPALSLLCLSDLPGYSVNYCPGVVPCLFRNRCLRARGLSSDPGGLAVASRDTSATRRCLCLSRCRALRRAVAQPPSHARIPRRGSRSHVPATLWRGAANAFTRAQHRGTS